MNRAAGAIVKPLVEAHGGSVRAVSPFFYDETGDGYATRISFSLPLETV
jgi:signal transduction histidine kinase